jgi:cell division septum initiation protein DivIVA
MEQDLLEKLKQENEKLKQKLEETETQLQKYTNSDRHKKYYENNKERIKANGLEYVKQLKEKDPEKLKEYRRTYYLKRKELKLNTDNNNNGGV